MSHDDTPAGRDLDKTTRYDPVHPPQRHEALQRICDLRNHWMHGIEHLLIPLGFGLIQPMVRLEAGLATDVLADEARTAWSNTLRLLRTRTLTERGSATYNLELLLGHMDVQEPVHLGINETPEGTWDVFATISSDPFPESLAALAADVWAVLALEIMIGTAEGIYYTSPDAFSSSVGTALQARFNYAVLNRL